MLARGDVDQPSACDSGRRARDTEDKPIVLDGGYRALQGELHPALCAGVDLFRLEQDDAAADLGGACVKEKLGAMVQRLRGGPKNSHSSVDAACDVQSFRTRQHVAAGKLIFLDANEVYRDSAARRGGLDLVVVLLQRKDSNRATAWNNLQVVAHGQRAVDKGARDDGAQTTH